MWETEMYSKETLAWSVPKGTKVHVNDMIIDCYWFVNVEGGVNQTKRIRMDRNGWKQSRIANSCLKLNLIDENQKIGQNSKNSEMTTMIANQPILPVI